MENSPTFKLLLSTTHSPIDAHFSKNTSDFVVREIPLYEFSAKGEHAVIEIQKKDMTTKEALSALSSHLGVKMCDFGYAGLKDKEGMTTQFISLPSKFENLLSTFSHEKMKILQITRHHNKIRLGHLKANSFFIRLKKVSKINANKLTNAINYLDVNGFANYFGYQRFGKFGDNALSGMKILDAKLSQKANKKFNPKLAEFMVSAYQSELFNRWLCKRVEISRFSDEFPRGELKKIYNFSDEIIDNLKSQRQFFKLFCGDVLGHYPFGKLFLCENLSDEVSKFIRKDRSVCGLIFGKKAFGSDGEAKKIENEIFFESEKFNHLISGSRRFAWVWADDIKYNYNEDLAHFNLSFTLQKGSYATVFLREILGREIFE